MADGYDLEVQAHLDDDRYRKKLQSLVLYTSKAGKKMERSLAVTARLNTKGVETQIAKLQSKKLADKNLDVDADTKKFKSEVNALYASTRAKDIELPVDAETSKAAAEVDAFVKAASAKEINIRTDVNNKSVQEMATSLTTATRAAEQLTGRLGTVGIVAGGAGLAVASITTALVGAVGISAASTIEQAQISLQALIGDSRKANALLKDFKTEADISPFELKDYSVTAAKFASATDDVDEIRERTLQAANAAAQYGGDIQFVGKALADVSNKGKLAGQEVIQFANAGIPIQGLVARFLMLNGTIEKMPLSDAIVEVGKLQEAGKITAQVVRDALDNALDPEIAEKFSKSLKGRLSTLRDAFKNAAAAFVGVDISNFSGETIVNPGGFYDTLGKSVTNLSETFNSASFKKPLEEAGTALGESFANFASHLPTIVSLLGQFVAMSARVVAAMFDLGAAFLEAFGPEIQKAMQVVSDNAETVAKVLGGLLAGGILLKIGSALIGIVTPMFNLLPAIAGIGSAIAGVGGAVTSLVATFKAMALAAALSGSTVAGVFLSAVAPITGIAAAVVLVGAAFVKALFKIEGLFSSVRKSMEKMREQLKPAIKLIGSGLKSAFDGVYAVVKPLVTFMVNLYRILANTGVIGAFASILGVVVQVIGKVIGGIGQFIGLIGKIPLFNKVIGDGAKNSSKAVDKNKDSVDGLSESMKKAEDTSKQFFESFKSYATTSLPEIDTTSIESARKTMDAQLTEMRDRVSNVTTLVKAGYSDLAQYAFEQGGEQGVALMQQFADAIKNNDTAALEEYKKVLRKMETEKLKIELFIETQRPNIEKEFIQETVAINKDAQKKLDKATKDLQKEIYSPGKTDDKKLLEGQKKVKDKLKKQVEEAVKSANIDTESTSGKKFVEDLTKKLLKDEEKRRGKLTKGPVIPKKKTPVGPNTEGLVGDEKEPKTLAPAGPTLGVASLGTAGADLAQGLLDGFTGFFKDVDLLGTLKTNFSESVEKTKTFITETVLPLGGKVISGIKQGILDALGTAGDILGSVKENITKGIGAVTGALGDLKTSVSRKAGEIFESAKQIGKNIWNGIVDGLKSAAGAVGDIASKIWNAVKGFINDKLIMPTKFFKVSILGKEFFPFINLPRLASGTNNFEGGVARVGERGPENVILPRGSKVIPAHKSKEKSTEVVNNYYSTINGVGFDQAAAEWEAKIRAQRREVFV